MPDPELSVIVTIVDAGAALDRCLTAIAAQQNVAAAALEVIVPWDASVPDRPLLERRFPQFRFLEMESRSAKTPAAQHEVFDRRRAFGLAAARGKLVAILEDRGVPRPDWARAFLQAHAARPAAVIGGAIENGRDAVLNWAVYFCDFGRYQLPYEEGPRPYVSDVNVCYRREALEKTRALWRDRYHETTVHWALLEAGDILWLSAAPVVDQQRDKLVLSQLLVERRDWGRLFAYTRVNNAGLGRRAGLAVISPLLPFVLLARMAAARIGKGNSLGKFVVAMPAAFLLLVAWCYGELLGYVTAKP